MKGITQFLITICILFQIIYLTRCQNAIDPNNPIKQNNTITPADTPTNVTCEKTQYTSIYTRCEINFDFCNQTTFKFVSCFKKQCERYVRASECRLWNKLQISQSQCYKQCCGAQQFNQKLCSTYNQGREQTQSSIEGVIIAIIVVSAVVLVGVAAFLLIQVQKCCQKNQSRRISKYNIFWKNQIVQDSTCQICHSYGAILMTPCKHYFHASCFEQKCKQDYVPLCPFCNVQIKERIKISCIGCKQKVFKIKLWKIQHLTQIMRQARALHDDICPLNAKSDELLLSPNKL